MTDAITALAELPADTPAADELVQIDTGEQPQKQEHHQEQAQEAPAGDHSPIPSLEDRPRYVVLNEPHKDDDGKVTHRAGVWYFGVNQKGDNLPVPTEKWICGPLYMDALTHDSEENNFGRQLRFRTSTGKWRTWAMPQEMLKADGAELRGELLKMGLVINVNARQALNSYLQSMEPKKQVRCVLQTGWAGTDFRAFALPDEVIGAGAGGVVFQSGEAYCNEYTTGGTLEGWRDQVAQPAVGNPVLMLALCAAFAGPLLARVNAESGGVHFVGDSSTGKTTALQAACSIWGGDGYRRSWRSTANGMEGAAAMFNDGLLALDEISECDPHDIGAIVYALGNGRGKQRASRTGAARTVTRWRSFIVSTGETTIETAMLEGGSRVKAGQAVRLIDIRVQRKHGAWDELHDYASGTAFSDGIKRAAATHHGHAGRAFLDRLTRDKEDFNEALAGILALPAFAVEGDGQVKRGAARFAILALAGELATSYGITGWPEGAATEAAAELFTAWQQDRGGNNANKEQAQIRQRVAEFIELHGASRFQDADNPQAVVHNRAGWRESTSGGVVYLFTASGMREATKGLDFKRSLDVLVQCGALPKPGADGKRGTPKNIKGEGSKRVYVIDPDHLEDDDHGT